MPKRIQRKRTKGWKLPPNAKSVTRPSKFGNPYHAEDVGGQWFVVSADACFPVEANTEEDAKQAAVTMFSTLHLPKIAHSVKAELRGKDLACVCSLDSVCHADCLLTRANED